MGWAKEGARAEKPGPEAAAEVKAKRAGYNPEKRAEAKRNARTSKREQEIKDFLSKGAQTHGFTAFLRSAELRISEALPRETTQCQR